MKKTRLIAFDLDGTLLDDRKAVPPANVRALQEAQAQGVDIAIASGRMTPRIEPIAEQLGVDCVIIAYNGARVVGKRAEGRPTIDDRPVPADIAKLFIEFSREQGYLLNFYVDDRLYAEDDGDHRWFRDLYSSRTGAEYHLGDLSRFDGVPPTKLILLAEPEEVQRLREHFSGELGNRASITRSEAEYLEIMAPGVDKGTALPAIARHHGITCEEILAVGDADNDAELIRQAGIGIAVANATEKCKSLADAITERTNNEGAVAEAVYRFVLERNG